MSYSINIDDITNQMFLLLWIVLYVALDCRFLDRASFIQIHTQKAGPECYSWTCVAVII